MTERSDWATEQARAYLYELNGTAWSGEVEKLAGLFRAAEQRGAERERAEWNLHGSAILDDTRSGYD